MGEKCGVDKKERLLLERERERERERIIFCFLGVSVIGKTPAVYNLKHTKSFLIKARSHQEFVSTWKLCFYNSVSSDFSKFMS